MGSIAMPSPGIRISIDRGGTFTDVSPPWSKIRTSFFLTLNFSALRLFRDKMIA